MGLGVQAAAAAASAVSSRRRSPPSCATTRCSTSTRCSTRAARRARRVRRARNPLRAACQRARRRRAQSARLSARRSPRPSVANPHPHPNPNPNPAPNANAHPHPNPNYRSPPSSATTGAAVATRRSTAGSPLWSATAEGTTRRSLSLVSLALSPRDHARDAVPLETTETWNQSPGIVQMRDVTCECVLSYVCEYICVSQIKICDSQK